MGYVEQNLISGETVAYRARLHWIMLFWPVVVAILLGVIGVPMLIATLGSAGPGDGLSAGLAVFGFVLFIIGALPLLSALVIRACAEFAVTNKRVILKTGVVRRRTVEMFLNKVESVGVDQTIAGRMLGYGTIILHGTGSTAEPFARISNPLEFRRQVHEQIARITEAPSAAASG